jgi:hypothetical protein
MTQYSWPGPMPPGKRPGTLTLVRCAQCQGRLYYTRLKAQPRQEDHEQGCQAFITAIRTVRYADELKQAASEPDQSGWRRNRRWRKYLLKNAKMLSVAACESDPPTAVRNLSDHYEAEGQAPRTRADVTRMAETLMRACRQLAVGEAPAPIVSSSGPGG